MGKYLYFNVVISLIINSLTQGASDIKLNETYITGTETKMG
jgi:hypothetical protein